MTVMMNVMMLLFLAHCLGDYYLTNGFLASRKAYSYFYTLIHCFIYAIPFIIVWVLFLDRNEFLFRSIFLIVVLHVPVDLCKTYVTKEKDKLMNNGIKIVGRTTLIYYLDQLVHCLSIVLMVMMTQFENGVSLDSLTSLGVGLVLFCLLGFQVYYVTVKKMMQEDRTISNWYSLKDIHLKLLSMLICLCLLVDFGLVVLGGCFVLWWLIRDKLDEKLSLYVSYSLMLTFGLFIMKKVIVLFICLF